MSYNKCEFCDFKRTTNIEIQNGITIKVMPYCKKGYNVFEECPDTEAPYYYITDDRFIKKSKEYVHIEDLVKQAKE